MKKILFYISKNQYGGAERVIINLCNEFVRRGYEVVLLLNEGGNPAYKIDEKVKIIVLQEKINFTKNKVKLHVEYIRAMIRVMKSEAPHVIVSFLAENNFRSIVVGKMVKIPTIVSVRVDPQMECATAVKKGIRRILYNHADLVVLQNRGAKERFGKWFKAKYEVIPNLVNEAFLKEPLIGERTKKIVAVGRLSKQKNFSMLIDAFKELNRENKDYQLIIYGEGEERERLEQKIREVKLTDKVFLPGNSDRIREEIYDAEIFVLCSDYEGVPNVLLEAMSLGLPCIATDIPNGACRDLIENRKNGILIPVGSVTTLIEEMNYLILNKEDSTQMGLLAAKYIRDNYSTDRVYDCWEKNILSCIKSE